MSAAAASARRALACLDLTDLDEQSDSVAVRALCARAATPHGEVAAVCVWPRFVSEARTGLNGTGVRVASVVNFPSGELQLDHVITMTRDTLADGADEIDMVIPWRRLARGEEATTRQCIREVRRAAGPAVLKVILETGMLGAPDLIRRAAELAVAEGADFLKTSTGKAAINATPEAAEIMLGVIARAGRPVGLKPAGGIRTAEDAALYLALCDRIMGEGWAGPRTFRIGASSLLNALLAEIEGDAAPAADGGY